MTLKAAVLACWPESDALSAVRAIKAGHIRIRRDVPENTSKSGSDDSNSTEAPWRVERSPGKRNILVSSNDPVELQWKGECRLVPTVPRFVAMHKPIGYVTSRRRSDHDRQEQPLAKTAVNRRIDNDEQTNVDDDNGDCDENDYIVAPTVYDLLEQQQQLCPYYRHHLRAVGRLDKNTEGLLLFTTQGRWIGPLTSPVHHVPKRYRCWLQNPATMADLQQWTSSGLVFRDRKIPGGLATARPAVQASFVTLDDPFVVDVTIVEGRYRQVRRCWESLRENRVLRLQRLSFGPIELDVTKLLAGQCRELSIGETVGLRQCVQTAMEHASVAVHHAPAGMNEKKQMTIPGPMR